MRNAAVPAALVCRAPAGLVAVTVIKFADEFWWLAHHHALGRPLLNRRVLGLGLAAALLGELLEGPVSIDSDRIVVSPADPVLLALAGELSSERVPQSLTVWLPHLAKEAEIQVAQRLRVAGLLRRDSSGFLGKQVWVPANMNVAGWPAARLVMGIREQRWTGAADAALAGLAWATGLDAALLVDAPPYAREFVESTVDTLPSAWMAIVTALHTCVGKDVVALQL